MKGVSDTINLLDCFDTQLLQGIILFPEFRREIKIIIVYCINWLLLTNVSAITFMCI